MMMKLRITIEDLNGQHEPIVHETIRRVDADDEASLRAIRDSPLAEVAGLLLAISAARIVRDRPAQLAAMRAQIALSDQHDEDDDA